MIGVIDHDNPFMSYRHVISKSALTENGAVKVSLSSTKAGFSIHLVPE